MYRPLNSPYTVPAAEQAANPRVLHSRLRSHRCQQFIGLGSSASVFESSFASCGGRSQRRPCSRPATLPMLRLLGKSAKQASRVSLRALNETRQPSGAQLLRPDLNRDGLASMKQANLSSFFGSKGRSAENKGAHAIAKPKEDASRGAKSASKEEKKPAVSGRENEVPAQSESACKPRKRLRKAGETKQDELSPSAASPEAAQVSDLPKGDSERVSKPTPGSANGNGQKSVTAPSPAELAAAVQNTMLDQSRIEEKGSDIKSEGTASPKKRRRSSPSVEASASAESASETEAEEEGKQQPKKKAVLKYKASVNKVEGVGTGSLAAAALHADFDLDKIAPWKTGAPVPFAYLAAAFEAIGSDSKRLAKTQQLVQFFRAILGRTPQDLLPTVYLCTNQIAPAHEGTELGIGDSILIKALAQATGRQEARIKKEYAECGDLGSVASSARGMQKTMFKPQPLTLQGVFKTFLEIARTEGTKSQEKKKSLINKLLVSSQENEPGYIMRALQGKLRIGLGAETVLVALAHAVLLHNSKREINSKDLANQLERASQAVKLAYSQCPSYDKLVPALLQYPVEEVHKHVHFVAGVPIKPMLAKPTTGVSEVLDKFQDIEFTCEYKYDGERAQIHITESGSVSIYSRNSENNTSKYPDLVGTIPSLLKEGVKSAVLDCEAVAFDRTTDKILPFQVLSTRARKDVKVEDIKVRVCIFAFDCLYLNGKTLLQEPLTQRRAALQEAVQEKHGELQIATAKTSTDLEELGRFLDESMTAGTEGLIVKTMDSTYEPSKRSAHWLKLKKDYLEGVGDTFDVVPIGGWHGKGKRKGVYGSYLLAIYNEDTEEFQTISKIGTGFSDEDLTSLSSQLNNFIIPEPKPFYKYGETLIPDVWFDAKAVWEVKAADLSVSPVHRAALGLVDSSKGVSIRFPRLVRVREDKDPEQATSAGQVAEMYKAQALLAGKNKGKPVEEDW